jgi:pSer/pThr/pTyr-binding forkhead associated (FHA) protein
VEKRGGGIGLIAPPAPSRTRVPTSLPTYRDEREALEALGTDTPAEGRQSGRHARLILPTGHAWPLSDVMLTIGRGTGNHLRLDDPLLAPEHAAIVRAGDEYVLIDWESERGTFVNGGDGRDLHFLQDGDRIEIGDSILIFRSGALATSRAGMTLFDWRIPSKEQAFAGASSDPVGGASFGDRRCQPEGSEHRTRGGRRHLTVVGGPRRGARCDSEATDCAWCGDYLSWFRFSVLIAGQAQGRFPVWADERAERPAWGAPPHFVFADDSGRRWLRVRFQVSLVTGWLLALAFLWWYLVLQ